MFIHNEVLASSRKQRDPRKYEWYVYNGRTATFDVTGDDKQEYDLSLKKGEKFGVKEYKGFYFLIDESELSLQLKLKPMDAKRILDNSKPYAGKIGRYSVKPGAKGNKPKTKKLEGGKVEIRADSSVFTRLVYDQSKKTLVVQFKSGAIWEYGDVTPEEAKKLKTASSQGRYFATEIRSTKPQHRLDHIP